MATNGGLQLLIYVGFPKRKLNPNLNESENPSDFGLQKIAGIRQHSDSNSVTSLTDSNRL